MSGRSNPHHEEPAHDPARRPDGTSQSMARHAPPHLQADHALPNQDREEGEPPPPKAPSLSMTRSAHDPAPGYAHPEEVMIELGYLAPEQPVPSLAPATFTRS